ncbi:uncharacterized protein [Phyllobates terribilis]|uniref:uncharacterized protein isoform X5 n=1 Tax=Phyllobates terribilis TaxID=111132 RepID=UPI003CCB1451
MAALSLHSDPFSEVEASSVKPLSQRVVRHALAIMHLLLTEGDLPAVGGTALHSSLDQQSQDKRITIDQIMKLVLGILHLLNEGPTPHEQAVDLSEEDWTHLEKEQRDLYSDLLSENEQTLQSLAGSFNVKAETVLGTEREDMARKETPPHDVLASGRNGASNLYTDLPADPSRSPVSDSYNSHTFLNPLKDGSHPFPKSSDHTSVYGTHSSVAFQRTCPNPSKDANVPMFSEAQSASSYGQAYAGSSTDDFAENISIIQIKQEPSPTIVQAQSNVENMDVTSTPSCGERALQIVFRKPGKSPRSSNGKRTHKTRKQCDVTKDYMSTQDSANREHYVKSPHSLMISQSYWGTYETSTSPKKPFQCLRCEKSFNCRSHLIMHHRVHTRERPYVCECGKAFTQSSNLFRHQRGHRHHRLQPNEQKYYFCPQCQKEFPDLSRLVTHQKDSLQCKEKIESVVETCDSSMR